MIKNKTILITLNLLAKLMLSPKATDLNPQPNNAFIKRSDFSLRAFSNYLQTDQSLAGRLGTGTEHRRSLPDSAPGHEECH